SIRPFLEYENKWTIVLGLTSNKGAADFEMLELKGTQQLHTKLYEKVLHTVAQWGSPQNLMFVVGATQSSAFKNIRALLPEHFFLVPGVGFQGGSLEEVSTYAMNKDIGLLVNASRAIIYAGKEENFAEEARVIAAQYQTEMKAYMNER
ncbi:MAG: orotidine 5'-phosphate decarboxylase, partial [Ferruginibacter sp.]